MTTPTPGADGAIGAEMAAVRLPGDSTVEHVRVPVPVPGHGQVLLRVGASSICGSDIRAIYREHLGAGPEAYQGVVAGHEPAGEVVALGPGARRLTVGDRVAVYHIVGCGLCDECRHGYEIGCTDPSRAAYGWQRDGGHAPYLLAEERSCLRLPEPLSLVDGALVSCGFGTAYEALLRLDLSGRDQLLVTGLGPVGLAAAMMGRAMGAGPVIGTDTSPERRRLAVELGAVDHALPADDETVARVLDLTGGHGCSATLDASGSAAARATALAATRTWGRCVFVGEGGRLEIDVSPLLIHRQLTVHGSWVTSVGHMGRLLQDLVRWQLRPECVVTDRFPLERADEAYAVAAAGATGKVCLVPG